MLIQIVDTTGPKNGRPQPNSRILYKSPPFEKSKRTFTKAEHLLYILHLIITEAAKSLRTYLWNRSLDLDHQKSNENINVYLLYSILQPKFANVDRIFAKHHFAKKTFGFHLHTQLKMVHWYRDSPI